MSASTKKNSNSKGKNTNTKSSANQKQVKKEGQQDPPHVKVSSRSANYKEISAIILLAICVFIAVCTLGKAPPLGDFVSMVLFGLFGKFGTYMMLITLVVFAITILRGTRASVFTPRTTVIIVFFILSVTALLHTLSGVYEAYISNRTSTNFDFISMFLSLWSSHTVSDFGGGVFAGALSTLALAFVSKIGALVIFIPMTLIFTLLLFRFSLLPFFAFVGRVFGKIGRGIASLFSRLFSRKKNDSHKPIKVVNRTPELDEDEDDEPEAPANDRQNRDNGEKTGKNDNSSYGRDESDSGFTPTNTVPTTSYYSSTEPVKKVVFEDGEGENGTKLEVDVSDGGISGKKEPEIFVDFGGIDDDETALSGEVSAKPVKSAETSDKTGGERASKKPAAPAKADPKDYIDAESFSDDPVAIFNSIEPGNLPVLSKGEYKNYKAPPVDLLSYDEEKKLKAVSKIRLQNEAMLDSLRGLFESRGIAVTCDKYYIGPSFSQFIVVPRADQAVKGIKSLGEDISVIVSGEDVRIEAPIPGENAIGIEMVNKSTFPVYQKDIISSKQFMDLDAEDLPVALGLDIRGNTVVSTMKEMIHIMIGGTTGSGKSVFTRGLILSLVFRASPDQVRLILVDPKKIEFPVYKNLPHLMTPIIYQKEKATNALAWVCYEMDKRYDFMQRFELNTINDYNSMARKNGIPTLPRIVVVIDEFADLVNGNKDNKALFYVSRIASLARACGIHLVLATQRPSAEIFTGILKANMPTKVCLLVQGNINSRIVLGTGGGEKLNGQGDMLCLINGHKSLRRLQNGFCSSESIKDIVGYIKVKNNVKPKTEAEQDMLSDPSSASSENEQLFFEGMEGGGDNPNEDKYARILEYVKTRDEISISELQRRFEIGYNAAAKQFDRLVDEGWVENSGPVGAKKRKVIKR